MCGVSWHRGNVDSASQLLALCYTFQTPTLSVMRFIVSVVVVVGLGLGLVTAVLTTTLTINLMTDKIYSQCCSQDSCNITKNKISSAMTKTETRNSSLKTKAITKTSK